jgi:hypothetical protein
MLKMDDEFATSAIVALSSFNYYYDGPCRAYLTQALKSSCTVIIHKSLEIHFNI